MNTNILRRLAGSLCAGLLLAGGTPAGAAADTPAAATADAVEGLLRVTRRNAPAREPFVLAEGPAETQAEKVVRDELEQAIILMQEKDYAAATPLLETAMRSDPTIEATWEALGWCYYHTGRPGEADELWRQYAALRPESPKAHSLLAQLAIARNDWRAADEHLSRSLALDPRNYDIRYWYAQNLFRLGRLEASLAIFEKLIAEDAQRYDVKVDLARTYSLLQRHEDSLDLWTEVVEVLPGNLAFRTEYARALMLVGSLDEADEEARRILAEDPAQGDVMNLRADLAEIALRPDKMVKSLRELIDSASDPEIRAKLRVRLGARLVVLNRKDPRRWPLTLALEQYAEAIEVVPGYVPWLNQYAQIALMAHQPDKARATVDRILRDLNPFNQQALRTRFEIEMLERNYDAAERALDALYDDYQPSNPYRFLDLARLEVARGQYPGALAALDRLEEEGNRGAVLTLLYHGLTESEWMALPSTRRFREHLLALRDAGFTFISPLDIPEYMKNARPANWDESKPWLSRQIDQVQYALTGDRKYRPAEEIRPAKVVAITFDDGLRSSFSLGTPIAQELGLTFGMFVITSLEELNAPMYAAWEEIRAYQESGAWQVGSHLMHANTDQPAGPEPKPLVFTLPNRVWLKDRGRLETLREWSVRVRREFTESRARIERHLGLAKDEPMGVAYPYGEIGQEEGSNVAGLINPVRAILSEADRQYQIGFGVDRFGYTCPVDNLLMVRRYEPDWSDNAEDVVAQVLENHPVFIARRMRVEIATLMNRPYLADQQIELLRRDGYPEKPLRELIAFTQNRIPGARGGGALDEADRTGTSRQRLRPSNLYVAGAYRENQSNEDILQRFGEGRAGLNLNEIIGLEVLYRGGTIDQTVTSNTWFEIDVPVTTVSSSTSTQTTDGETTTISAVTETTTINKVQTNRVEKFEFDADVEEARGVLTLRINDAATLTGSVGMKWLTLNQPEPDDESEHEELVASLAVAWQRMKALQVVAFYDHDLVPSARREISYDGFGLSARWKVRDGWDVAGNARYLSYDDDNAMVQLTGSSFWQLFERQGIWGGLEASTYSTDEDSGYYWTPYWDTRYAAVVRLHRSYQDYFFQFDVRLGQQREDARPEDEQAWRNLKAQADKDGSWYPGPNPDADWDTFAGLGCNYRQRIWRFLDLIGSLNVNFLRDYSEHDFTLGLQVNF